MSRVNLDHVPPAAQTARGGLWLAALGLSLLLPVLEWAGLRLLHVSGLPLTTASLWATTLVVNVVFLGLLFKVSGRIVRPKWTLPGLKDLGLTVVAFVAGWVVIPTAKWVVGMMLSTASGSGGTGVSLVPSSAIEMVLLAGASIVTALSQETTYRGLLWERLGTSTGNRWVALVGSSVFFGLIYVSSGLVDYLSVGVAWGLVAGGLYLATRCLSAVVLLNGLNTFLTYAVLFRYLT